MASTSPGYGITIRVEGPPSAQPVAEVTTAITAAGAAITALANMAFLFTFPPKGLSGSMRLKKDLKIFQQSVVQTYDAPGLAHVGNRSHNLSLVARQ